MGPRFKAHMTEGLGLREFGRLLGVSGEAIRKAIKTGRIPASAVGEKSLSSGRKVPYIADVEAARVAFAGNTNPAFKQDGARISAGKKAANAAARGGATAEHVQRRPDPPRGADRGDDGNDDGETIPSINQSRAITEAFKAKITRLEYEEQSGKLVDAEEFRSKFTSMVSMARTRLLGVPSKAKGRIPHLNVDEIDVLNELIREALEDSVSAR